ncbi:hypothetical protein [Paenibacillus sp. J22TS3]|uniref:hypothetical protein n=1 Tax=Paenibacillus sp. J22TS3 TaxID=2807192 RepID=UPI001BD0A5F9|nr:hypothetical protein [Paenibacillus sp. J22TS3]
MHGTAAAAQYHTAAKATATLASSADVAQPVTWRYSPTLPLRQPVCHSPPLRLRIILPIAVPPGFLDCILQGRNPGAKANASLLQDDSASSADVARSWYGNGCPVYRMATKATSTLRLLRCCGA